MCNCKNLKDFYDGLRVDDIPELASKLKELSTDFKKWETIYICPDCEQKWMEKYSTTGHGEVPYVKKLKRIKH